MKAVTYHGPEQIAVEEVADPVLRQPDDAIIRITASGVCGSDLHTYRGRIEIEDGFTLGHEYVGEIVEAGGAVESLKTGDRVVGAFHSCCGRCFMCRQGEFHKCDEARTFGSGAALGDLPGTQAEYALIPHANMTLRRLPEGMSEEVAMFAGDVSATAYHACHVLKPGETVAVLGMGPIGLAVVQMALAFGASRVVAIDQIESRLDVARQLGAEVAHLAEDDVKRCVRDLTEGRGADRVVEAVGNPAALNLAISLVRRCGTVAIIGAYAEQIELPMGLAWIKSVNFTCGQTNPLAHMDQILALLESGRVDPSFLVTHHMSLDEAPEAYDLFNRREALKIMLHTETEAS